MEKRVAIVTGGGRSLGKAMAERLHKDGFSVAVVDRDRAAARAVAESLDTRGKTAGTYALSSATDVAETLRVISSDLGVPTALVNNAGVYPDHALLDMPVEAWDEVMSVNLRGTFLCTQAFARLRREMRGGAIGNLASTAGFSARAGASHYSASKAGVVMFTKAAALELAPLGILVNAVAPGLIEVRDDQMSKTYRDQYLTMIPRGRIGKASDVAGTIAFLLSEDADFINGECVTVDGGFFSRSAFGSGRRRMTPTPLQRQSNHTWCVASSRYWCKSIPFQVFGPPSRFRGSQNRLRDRPASNVGRPGLVGGLTIIHSGSVDMNLTFNRTCI